MNEAIQTEMPRAGSVDEERLAGGVFYRHWRPQESPRAVILLVHGLGEHSGRYADFARYFTEQGVAVVAPDHLGHGESPGVRGHIGSFAEFIGPLDERGEAIWQWYSEVPGFLFGHSMSGLICACYLLERQDWFEGAALSASALQAATPPSAGSLLMIRLMTLIWPTLGVMQLDPAQVSRDPEVVQRYIDDPLVHSGKISAGLAHGLFQTMAEVAAGSHSIRLPVLIMHGDADAMTTPAGSEAFYEAVSSSDKRLRIYPQLYHEIFNEPERLQVLGELRDWIVDRV
jgi:alpha-beta hydrolase superfamily lysophospholipase